MENSLLSRFILYIETERRYSALTVRNYRADISLFIEWVEQSVTFDPQTITSDDVREWIILRGQGGKRSSASINRELSSLRSFWRWMRSVGATSNDIFAPIKSLRSSKRLPTFVTASKVENVVERCGEKVDDFAEQRNRLIVLMLYGCGLRLAELLAIKINDFSDQFATLRVHGKGDKERIVPIVEGLRLKIMEHRETIISRNICKSSNFYLILTLKGELLSRNMVYRIVKQELYNVGIQGKRSPHVLRHTFATQLLNEGADMREIQELMGHASLQSTQIYTHNSIAQLQNAYRNAHPRARRSVECKNSTPQTDDKE